MNQLFLFREHWANPKVQSFRNDARLSMTHRRSLLNSWWDLSWLRYTRKINCLDSANIPKGWRGFSVCGKVSFLPDQNLYPHTVGRASIDLCDHMLMIEERDSLCFLPCSFPRGLVLYTFTYICRTGWLYPKKKTSSVLSPIRYLTHKKREVADFGKAIPEIKYCLPEAQPQRAVK